MADEEELVGKPMIEQGEIAPEQMEELEKGEYHTIAQIARELCYTRAWILDLIHQGRIKAIKPLGGRWRVPNSEYRRIIKEGIPPMAREEDKKPPVTEIEVTDERLIEKEKKEEPERKEPPPPSMFPFSTFFGGGKE